MPCRYTYNGKTYSVSEFDDLLRAMPPAEASKFMPSVKSVPSAPFVGRTDAWVALSLKRMIRYAAENGFDRVAWTTGEKQVERYGGELRKAVDEISWKKTEKGIHLVGYKGGPKVTRSEARIRLEELEERQRDRGPLPDALHEEMLRLRAEGKNKVVDTTEKEDALSDAIGKAMAERIIKDPAQSGTISGENLRIDETGMAAFYDRIVPNVANDILKKLGGKKVETIEIGRTTAATKAGEVNIFNAPGFDITPEMREKALQGQPLFSRPTPEPDLTEQTQWLNERGEAKSLQVGFERFALQQRPSRSGSPNFGSRELLLVRRASGVFGDTLNVDYEIFDTQEVVRRRATAESPDGARVGVVNLTLDRTTGRILALNNLVIDEGKQGRAAEPAHYGERVVRAMLATLPEGAKLQINTILPSAIGFWRKLGTIPKRGLVLYNGVLTRSAYERSRGQDFGRSTRPDRMAEVGEETPDGTAGAGGDEGDRGPAGELGLQRAGLTEFLESPATAGLSVSAVENIAGRFRRGGMKIVVVPDESALPRGLRENIVFHAAGGVRGAYFLEDDTVYLVARNLRSEAEAGFVALHEAAHRGLIKLFGEQRLTEILLDLYHLNASLRREVDAAVADRGKLTKDEVKEARLEEIEEALADRAYRGVARNLNGWPRLVQFIRDWLRERGIQLAYTDAEIEMFVGAATRAGLGGVAHLFAKHQAARFSMAQDSGFSAAVDSVLDGKIPQSAILNLGNTPLLLTRLGLPRLPLQTTGDVIDKAFYDHGLTRGMLRELPALIADPVAVFDSDTRPGTFVVALDQTKGTKPVLVAVHPNEKIGRVEVNFVPTAYAKDNSAVIGVWASKGLLRYVNTQKSPAWQTTVGVQFPGVGPAERGSKKIILTERDIVNPARFSRAPRTLEQEVEFLLAKPRGTAPLDVAFRAVTQATGLPKATEFVGRKIEDWMDRIVPEPVKAGVLSDYGLPEAVGDKRDAMFAHLRQQTRKVGAVLDKLATLSRAEARVAYEWMNNRDADALLQQLPPESRETLTQMKDWIDELSREAVRLGQLSNDAYERNKMAYLHRSYLKHETDQTKLQKASRARTMRVLGEQYKGRGIFDPVDANKVKNANPEWWRRKERKGQADAFLRDEKFIRLEKRANRGEGVGALPGLVGTGQQGRLLGVTYWPADVPVPSTLAGYERAGVWKVVGAKRDRIIMWRDFTKAERVRMGELDEVRYAFAKTMQQMIHDTEVGGHLEWLANTQAKPEPPGDAQIEEASELLRKAYPPGTWVKVPDAEIPKTGGVKKYGKLAGLWLPGPVWNDLRQIVNYRYQPLGETYATILRAWKISKALALDTPIPTPNGWTTMGEIRVGDKVFDDRGKVCEVLGATDVQLNRKCYEVVFSDDTKIVADEGHLWFTIKTGSPGVRTTKQIRASLKQRTRGDNNHSIPVAGALALPDVDLPISPYALGVWLGDGHTRSARVSAGGDDAIELIAHLNESGVRCGTPTKDKRNNVLTFRIHRAGAGCQRGHEAAEMTPKGCRVCANAARRKKRRGEAMAPFTNQNLQAKMRSVGMIGNKHIPSEYLRSSERQRRELLMGLMDTDGNITERGICAFTSTLPALRDGAAELLRSLGYKPTITSFEPICNGKPGKTAWVLHFKAYADKPAFKLVRKKARLQLPPATRQRSQTRQIVSVTPVASVPVRCIAVSSQSKLYLAGDGMVPTHNTALSPTVHMNNIMANIIMADWHDVTAAHVLAALKVFVKKSDAHKAILDRFEDAGGLQGMYVLTELQREQLRPLLEALEREVQQQDGITGMVNVANFFQLALSRKPYEAASAIGHSRPAGLVKTGAGKLMDLYQAEDTVFRLAAFMKAKEEGLDDVAAGKFARRSFMDYQINAPWINILRNSVLPFVAFTYRALPMLWDTAVHKPWKLIKLSVILGLLDALGYALSGGDEDEERRLLPEEKAGRVLGLLTPKLVRMPWNTGDSPTFLDIRRFIPLGDIVDIGQGHAAVPILPALMPGGPLVMLAEILLNKKAFTGRPITKDTDTPKEATEKLAKYAYQALAPNLLGLPYSYASSNVMGALGGETDPFGREQNVRQAIMGSFGWKEGAYPKDVMLLRAQRKLQAQEREVGEAIGGLRRQRERGAIDQEEYIEDVRRQEEKRAGLRRQYREKVAPAR